MLRRKIYISNLCECGCGEEIGEWGYRTDREQPKYIKGHFFKVNREKRKVIFIDKECACGCGEIIGEWANRPSRKPPIYKGGHQLNNIPAKKRKLNKRGYVLIHMPEYRNSYKKNGNILEHRYVMEQHLGRDLLPSEDIHHINQNKTDNRIENLQVIDHIEHAKRHRSSKESLPNGI